MRHVRHGFTLFELLLVLVLLVVIGAIAAPAIGRISQTQQLRSSAELIRGQWARARVQAMKSGRVHAFRFIPDADFYAVDVWAAADDALEVRDEQSAAGSQLGSQQGGGEPTAGITPQLPEGVKFLLAQTLADGRSEQVSMELEAELRSQANWSAPILFYADGTTSSAELVLANRRDTAVRVRLRGLTGVAQVSEMFQLEDSSP